MAAPELSQLVDSGDLSRARDATNQQESHAAIANALTVITAGVNRALLRLMRLRGGGDGGGVMQRGAIVVGHAAAWAADNEIEDGGAIVAPPSPSATVAALNGVSAAGVAVAYARGDHTHLVNVLTVQTADPAVLANDMAWLFRDGASPENLSLRVRNGGVTYDIPLFTFP